MRGTRFFRLLLRILPFEIREAHGRDMEQVFRQSSAERHPGIRAATRFWFATVLDLLRIAPRQHLEALLQDVRYAARTFRAAPAFVLATVLTIAIGVGATTAVFALVDAVLLRPLPFADPERIAIVWAVPPEGHTTWLAVPELDDIRERVPAFSSVAGLSDMRLVLTGAGTPEELDVVAASANLPEVVGFHPALGSWFGADQDVRNAAGVVVLSAGLWRERFGARPEIVGTQVQLNGRPHTVVGVMPAGFAIPPPSSVFPAEVDAWVPLGSHVAATGRDVRLLHVLARLRDGASFGSAQTQASEAAGAVSSSFAEYRSARWNFEVRELHRDLTRSVRPALLVLFATVGLVLFIATANVCALLLSRGAARQHELAVRVALGASSGRLLRQLVTEGVLLGLGGGAIGLLLAGTLAAMADRLPLASIPRFSSIEIDGRVLLFAFGLSLLSALVATIVSIVAAHRAGASEALRVRDRAGAAIRTGRLLAVAEIALACTVLTVALVLARGFGELVDTDPGFRLENLATFRISLTPQYSTADRIAGFFNRAVDELSAKPGIRTVAAVTQLPLSGASLGSTFLLEPADARRVDADLRGITPGYFAAMEIPLLEGRAFASSDSPNSPSVAIVDEQFARKAWPGEPAIGKRIRWFRAPDRELEVVGVVAAVRHRGFAAPARETVYRPHTQYARPTMFMVARTSGESGASVAPFVAGIASVDAAQPIAEFASMRSLAHRSLAQPGLGAIMVSLFATIAITLTAVGTYGLFAYAVNQRRREVGVRLALGATPRTIVALIMADGGKLAAAALVIGLPAAWIAGTVAARWLALPVAMDAVTVGTAAAVVLASTAAACWLPSRRAARVSPSEPLRT